MFFLIFTFNQANVFWLVLNLGTAKGHGFNSILPQLESPPRVGQDAKSNRPPKWSMEVLWQSKVADSP